MRAQGLSTFAVDLQQMAHVLNNATGHSLVVVDEFGKGRRPGAAGDGRTPRSLP